MPDKKYMLVTPHYNGATEVVSYPSDVKPQDVVARFARNLLRMGYPSGLN